MWSNSKPSQFEYMDLGAAQTVCVVPGWAMGSTDSLRDCEHMNGVVVHHINPDTFGTDLQTFLTDNEITVSVYWGISLGARLLINSASVLGNSPVVISGFRPVYPKPVCRRIRLNIKQSRSATLTHFFQQCLAPEKRHDRTVQQLLTASHEWSDAALMDGLDALACPISWHPNCSNWRWVHGKQDQIAPYEELMAWAKEQGIADHVTSIPLAGHLIKMSDWIALTA